MVTVSILHPTKKENHDVSTKKKSTNLSTQAVVTVGPHGSTLTAANLPPPNTRRWVPSRKATVIHAVRGNVISKQKAMEMYNISAKEFAEWEVWYDKYGMAGLRVTHIQDHRPAHTYPLKDL